MVGLSPVTTGRNSLGTAQAAEKVQGSLFRNGLRASAVMTTQTTPSKSQREDAKQYMAEVSGAINAGSTPLLPGGWELKPLSLPPKDVELLQTISYSVEDICRWFDVQPVMIGHMEKSTAWGTGLEQMNLWYLAYSLRPRLKHIEQTIAKSLLTPFERKTYYAEFNVDGLLRADSAARSKLYQILLDHGVVTSNEVRAMENLPPLPGGDELRVNSAMLPLSLLGQFVRGKTDNPLDPNYQPPDAAVPPGTEPPAVPPKQPAKAPAP
jgi:HK97 family phage portal protein